MARAAAKKAAAKKAATETDQTQDDAGDDSPAAAETAQPETAPRGKVTVKDVELDTKHTSHCLEAAADDEPVFVLRGVDPAAPAAIRAWATEAERIGANPEKVERARREAKAIAGWQKRNRNRVKVPD